MVESFSVISGAASVTGAYFDYKTSQKGEPIIVTPPITEYSEEVMSRAADELENAKNPCPRDLVTDNCSVLSRMVIDYGDLRAKIRAAKKDE